MTAFIGLLACDIVRAVAGLPPRYSLGRVAPGTWALLGIDTAIIFALLRWRPATVAKLGVEANPGYVAGATLIAAAFGIAIDSSQIGYFPVIATARAGGRSSRAKCATWCIRPTAIIARSGAGRWSCFCTALAPRVMTSPG